MTVHKFPWQRYWARRESTVQLTREGYLLDPGDATAMLLQPGLFTLQNSDTTNCRVLLGEPGIGKSSEVDLEFSRSSAADSPTSDSLRFDLAGYGTDTLLDKDLFECEQVARWKTGNYFLNLFLDSLDECLLRIETTSALFKKRFAGLPLDRMRLNIACRTASWPMSLETVLGDLFGGEGTLVCELQPLRRSDIAVAAERLSIEQEPFLRAIEDRNVVPLATKPVTLRFLLEQYKQTGTLPASTVDLYAAGMLQLCEESNVGRSETVKLETSARQRLALASRLATVTLVGRRAAIWRGRDSHTPKDFVSVSDLAGGNERASDGEVPATAVTIQETLDTGLFTARESNALGWSHHTYAEFLAARYLSDERIPIEQIASLVVHPSDPEKRVIPQLRGLVGILASVRADVLELSLRHDPAAVLLGDATNLESGIRGRIVDALLSMHREEQLLNEEWSDLDAHYKKLKYDGIEAQLRPIIVDKDQSSVVRRAALAIAAETGSTGLSSDIVAIAVEPGEAMRLRIAASRALSQLDSPKERTALRVFAFGDALDTEDELKGLALAALWPEQLSTQDLLKCLSRPKDSNFFGAYNWFLSHSLPETISAIELPIALDWATALEEPRFSPFDRFVEALGREGWNRVFDTAIARSLARLALSQLREYELPLARRSVSQEPLLLNTNAERRRLLMLAVVDEMEDSDKDSWLLVRPSLLVSSDVPWLVSGLLAASSERSRSILRKTVVRLYDPQRPEHLELLFRVAEDDPALRLLLDPLMAAVDLASDRATEMRNAFKLQQKWEKTSAPSPKLLIPSPKDRAEDCLNRFDSGDLNAWWHLNLELTLTTTSTHYGNEHEFDITVLPGWLEAGAELRSRIVGAAVRFLNETDPKVADWLGGKGFDRIAASGYRALGLLQVMGSGDLVGHEAWQRWAPVVLVFPRVSLDGGNAMSAALLREAYRRVPSTVIDTVHALAIAEDSNRDAPVLRRLSEIWDPRLEEELLSLVKKRQVNFDTIGSVAEVLLDSGSETALSTFIDMIAAANLMDDDDRGMAVALSVAVARIERSDSWPVLWTCILANEQYGQDVVTALANGGSRYGAPILKSLTVRELADLFIWLAMRWRYPETLHSSIGIAAGPVEAIGLWRDGVLRILQQRGTFEAVDALVYIRGNVPELDWLKYSIASAQAKARASTWDPPAPLDILHLLGNSGSRLVRSERDLFDLLMAVLIGIEHELQAKGQVEFLWDNVSGSGETKPKDETALSNWVAYQIDRELAGRGVVVNREVQVRRGELHDIHVSAVTPGSTDPFDIASVVIESKGCWHKDLKTAMSSQLIDKYMRESNGTTGIYLVGWFNCDRWDPGDYRRKQAPDWTLLEARQYFNKQAGSLSGAERLVKAAVLNTALA